MRAIAALILLVALPLGGCATAGSGGDGSDVRGSQDHITSEELRSIEMTEASAFRAIERLRPNWLRSRGSTFEGQTMPRVVVDGSPYGRLPSLRNLQVIDIAEMRYLDASDATTRFGTGYPGGAILVFTRR